MSPDHHNEASRQPADAPPSSPLKLKYYMFDWDDNVLHMPTRIYLEKRTDRGWKPCEVSTAEFARMRGGDQPYRPPEGNWDLAFRDFDDADEHRDNPFLDDTRKAIQRIVAGEETPAPSFDEFKEALVEGSLFAIITARAHGSRSIREAVEYLIEQALSPMEKRTMLNNLRQFIRHFEGGGEAVDDERLLSDYLDLCHYWGVSSEEFRNQMGLNTSRADSPEIGKQVAIRQFVTHVIELIKDKKFTSMVSVGFSDDDPDNVRAAEEYLREELSCQFPGVKFVVYDTSDPALPRGRKMVIEEERDSPPATAS